MDQPEQMTLIFRCPPGLETTIPQPIPAVLGRPDWFKTLPQKAFNATMGEQTQTVKKCSPSIDANSAPSSARAATARPPRGRIAVAP
jgi:hypothetical protein